MLMRKEGRDESPADRNAVLSPTGDPVLLPFTSTVSEEEAERLLEELASVHAEPLIKRILRRRLGRVPGRARHRESQDLEDVAARVMLQLLGRLRVLRSGADDKGIDSFRSYVIAVTVRGYHQYLRERYPRRHRLKNKLRHLVTTDAALALWETKDRGWVCGLSSWERDQSPISTARAPAVHESAPTEGRSALRPGGLPTLGPVVDRVLKATDRPIAFDVLVSAVAELVGMEEDVAVGLDEELDVPGRDRGRPPSFMTQVDWRIYLRQLWPKILQLPLRQRQALLLNLTDREGRDLVALLPATGVASLRQIAEALEMSAEQLAQLWNDLPLDDLTLAGYLGLTRQQVVNLRRDARLQLARQAGIAPRRLRIPAGKAGD